MIDGIIHIAHQQVIDPHAGQTEGMPGGETSTAMTETSPLVYVAHQLLVRSGKPRKIMTAKKRTQILTPSNNTIIIHDHEIFLKWN